MKSDCHTSSIRSHNRIPIIYGFNTTSEAGPDVFTPSIFLFGCNLRCPYCFNSELVEVTKNRSLPDPVPIETILSYVKDNCIDKIHISGGEPLVHPLSKLKNLFELLSKIGCKIGLSTNGFYSDKLFELKDYLYFVSLDYKIDSAKKYNVLDIRQRNEGDLPILKTLNVLRYIKKEDNEFDYEVRTTLFPLYVNEDVLISIGRHLHLYERWVLQKFRIAPNMLRFKDIENVRAYSDEECESLFSTAKRFTTNCIMRDV